MKAKQKAYFGIMSLFLMLFVLSCVSATISFNTPTAGSNQSSAIAVKVYFVNGTDFTDPTAANTTLYYNTTTTAWTSVDASCTSWAQNGSQVTCTLAITAIPDAKNVRLNMTLGNGTDILGGIVSSAFTVDDTNPVVSVAVSETRISQRRLNTITWSATDATSGISSTSVTVVSPDTVACPTLTYTTATGTQTISEEKTACNGDYTVTLTTTDYAGNSNTASTTFKVTTPDGKFIGEKSLQPIGEEDTGSKKLFAVIAIAIIAYFVFIRKK